MKGPRTGKHLLKEVTLASLFRNSIRRGTLSIDFFILHKLRKEVQEIHMNKYVYINVIRKTLNIEIKVLKRKFKSFIS